MGTSSDFVSEEEKSAHNVAAAAEKAGVRRIVYLSGLHPKGELSRHLESRNAVGEILMESGVETVVLQAGIVIGSGSASFEMIRHLTDRLPVMTTPKWVRNKIQPISIDDVLHYLAEAADRADCRSRAPSTSAARTSSSTATRCRSMPRRRGCAGASIVALPLLTPSIASWWVGLVTPIPSGLARPLVESLEHDAVMSEHDIDAVIPPPPGG